MIYVLVYPKFDTLVEKAINSFRATHEPERAELVPPHITLVFGIQNVDLYAFTKFCERSVHNAQRFTVSFSEPEISYDPFERTHKILLPCTKGREELLVLHRKLYDGPHFAQFDPAHPYSPHMTVGANKSLESLDTVSTIVDQTPAIQGQVGAIHVVEVNSGQLQSLKSIPFLS